MYTRLKQLCAGMVMVLAGFVIGMPQEVQAASDGYPYPDTRCVHAPYAASGSGAGWCPDYDWGLRPGDESRASVISPYGYYYRNCTDYAAWWLAAHGVLGDVYKGLGDAKYWPRAAAAKGLRVDGVPAAGAIGVRTTGTYGHIAVVEEVDVPGQAPGTIRVSEYNRQATGVYGERTGTPAQLGLTSFIHFGVVVAPPAAPAPVPQVPAPPVPEAPEATAIPTVTVSEVPVPASMKTPEEAGVTSLFPDMPEGMPDVSPQAAGVIPEVSPVEEGSNEGADESTQEVVVGVATLSTLMRVPLIAPAEALAPSGDVSESIQVQPVVERVAGLAEEVLLDILPLQEDGDLAPGDGIARDVTENIVQAITSPVYAAPPIPIPVRWWQPTHDSPPVLMQQARLVGGYAPVSARDTTVVLTGLSLVLLLSGLGWTAAWQWWAARRHLPATYRHLGAG